MATPNTLVGREKELHYTFLYYISYWIQFGLQQTSMNQTKTASIRSHVHEAIFNSNQLPSREIIHLVASVHLNFHLFVNALLLNPFDLWSWFLVLGCILTYILVKWWLCFEVTFCFLSTCCEIKVEGQGQSKDQSQFLGASTVDDSTWQGTPKSSMKYKVNPVLVCSQKEAIQIQCVCLHFLQ